ncbi:GSCOCT00014120001.2-RA-CDS [Cotesia congregata]|uniref:Cc_K425_459 n=1 Tax=Cotesia congregata TaxID=51543 RepID=A0A8J2HA46_COTCN|nr:GSCOCT00014120001.2-RA-CDS [Cotesia congregata]CAG5089941.1 Cc_K425_459 [Cotesia congregata]
MSAFFTDKSSDIVRYKQLDSNLRGYNLTEYVNVSTTKGDCFAHYFYATPINNQTLKLLKNNHVDRLACIYVNKRDNKVLFIRYDGLAKSFDDIRTVIYDYWTIKEANLMMNDNNNIDYYIEKINRDEITLIDTDKNSMDDYEYVGYAHWRYFDRGILYYGTRYLSDEGVVSALENDQTNRNKRDFLESFILYATVHESDVLWSRNQINDFVKHFHIQSENVTVVLPIDENEDDIVEDL